MSYYINYIKTLSLIFMAVFLLSCEDQQVALATEETKGKQSHQNISIEDFSSIKKIPKNAEERAERSYANFKERSALAEHILTNEINTNNSFMIKYLEQRNKIIIDEYFHLFYKKELTDNNLINHYEANKNKFSTKEIEASTIFIKQTPSNQNDVKNKIKGILEEYRKGTDFYNLIQKFSDKKGDSLASHKITINSEKSQPEIVQALSSLSKGDISLPIYGPRGVTIYEINEITTLAMPYEEVKDRVIYSAKEIARNKELQRLKDQLIKQEN